MAIDVTQNSQYIALKQSFDAKIDTSQQVEDTWKDFKDVESQMGYLSSDTPEWQALSARYDADMKKMSQQLDPDASIRQQIVDGQDPAAILKQQETDALGALATVLNGGSVDKANQAALDTPSTGPAQKEDVMTRAMSVFAMLGNATDGVSNGYMDQITDNVDKITDLNGLTQTVRSDRPTGTDTTKTAPLDANTVKQLQGLGVTLPASVKPDDKGNYNVSQADYDTILNNVQSQSSSLTTLNQNTTISLNKSIDVGQQCSSFQASDLEKWAQVMQKILG